MVYVVTGRSHIPAGAGQPEEGAGGGRRGHAQGPRSRRLHPRAAARRRRSRCASWPARRACRNPYLSQIERGLRKPSAEILQQIAKALRISAEALYVQAGILEEREGTAAVAEAILSDELITERQKHVLLEIYDSFRKENDARTVAARRALAGAEEGVAVQVSEDRRAGRHAHRCQR